MRKYFVIPTLMLTLGASAQIKWNQAYQQYFDQYKDIAIEQMLKYHIPASITLAQGAFESGAGRSELTRRSNNHFGIKCHGWTGRTSYHDDDERNECFRGRPCFTTPPSVVLKPPRSLKLVTPSTPRFLIPPVVSKLLIWLS